MITHHIDQDNHIVEVTISGKIITEELNDTVNKIQAPFEQWDEIRLLKRIDSFEGIEWKALLNDFKFAFQNLSNFKKIKKVAVVTDKDWVENLTEWFSSFFPGEVKIFENEDIDKARAWLQ